MSANFVTNKLLALVNRHYKTDDPKVSLLKEGIDNDLYLVKDSNTKFVMRVGKRQMGKVVEFEVKLLNHLAKDGVPVPKIISAINSENYILQKDDTIIVCFEFIKGQSLTVSKEQKPSLSVVQQAGEALGKFHQSSKSFRLNDSQRRTIYTEFNRVLKISDKLKKNIDGGIKFLKEVEDYTRWSQRQNCMIGAIHNDYGPENIMVSNGTLNAIIDFDWAGPGPFAKDVGLALALWSLPDGLENHWQDVINQFLAGYNEYAPAQLKFNDSMIKWINLCCLSDTATFFADLPEDNTKITKISQCRRYKKFLYFKRLLGETNV